MENEQAKTIEALQFAIQMETDGKKYYQKASQESENRLGKEFFQWLANEEDNHRRRFEEIYKTIEAKKTWPEVSIQPVKRKGVKTLFAEATKTVDSNLKAHPAELDTIAIAIHMENKTHDFYKNQSQKTPHTAEKNFYEALAVEEKSHYLALIDYREYLLDPPGWFRKMEHHSLDGG